MGSRELLLFTVILLALFLPSCFANGFPSVTGFHERRGTSSREQPSAPQWQLLTNRNFSSQIRLHQHILLMVTVPWYGESRSIMKEISHLVAIKQEELGHLSLMVVYRNSDKLLADVLGANEGITFFYYHHSIAYKYRGRLCAHIILSSVYQVMPLGLEDFPLKHLQTKEDLDTFYHSTDRAILLLEFCGWSTQLLHKQKNESNGNHMYMQSFSENAGNLLNDQNRDDNGTVILDNQEIYEDLENEEFTCRVDIGLNTWPWAGEFTWVNESVSKGTRSRDSGLGLSCTQQEFQRFESFFTKFMSTAKEYSLPPERQRFGLVSETSLLPFLGVSDPETWLIVLQFPLCPNCSEVVQEVDDLHAVLKMDDSLVMELGVVDQNSQLALPADRPSIILFVDRSSSSSEIKNASKLALETFKQFARDCHLSTQVNNNSRASLAQVISSAWHKNARDPFSRMTSKVSPVNKLVKLKDDMAIMIINEGENTSLDNTSQAQNGQFYNILAELLHRREPAVDTKDTKISLLAKEVGFQLLSDDFHVQVVDKLPSHTEEHTQHDKMIESDTVSLVNQNTKQPEESTEQSSDLSGYMAMNDEEIPELVHMEGDIRQNQQVVPSSESSSSTTDNVHMAVCQPDGSEFTCSADNSSRSNQKSPLVEEHTDKENVHNFDYRSSEVFSSGFAKNLAHELSEVVSVEEGSSEHAKGSMDMARSGEPFVGRRPFLGSFFLSDGNHQFLETMTASSKTPSLILLDPLLQHHYVLSEKENITYSSIANFIDQFLDGNLTPYQKSEAYFAGSRETPHPPFVNLDFREADSIPRVTAKTFCELIVGFKHCETKGKLQPSSTENLRPAYNADVLVLFSTTWCGFCQRMELVVREVYRAFKSFSVLLKNESLRRNSRNIQENNEDTLIGLPSIYLLDCSLNDCGSFLLPLGKEERYPTLLLFPAGNKQALSYEGYLSVGSIIEFLISHGSNSHNLNMHKGLLWTQKPKSRESTRMFGDMSSPLEDNFNEIIISERTSGDNGYSADNLSYDQHVIPGTVLTATDKLLNSFPFNNSTILIVTADKDQGFQGLIINKQISWNIFKEFSQETESIKLAPLSYGGPVVVDGLPLVSLVRNSRAGYTTVHAGLYFGNAVATSLSIKEIKSGKQSASDYWFFLGFSSWGWKQLFNELAEGAWHLSDSPIASLDWPLS